MMERRAEVPGWLAISWWWLAALVILRFVFFLAPKHYWFGHAMVSLLLWSWTATQQVWLKNEERESRAIYWYVASLVLTLSLNFFTSPRHPTMGLLVFELVVALGSLILWVVGIYKYAEELESHFEVSRPYGLGLSGVMIFFFSTIYFQYKLREIYVQDHEPEQLSITPFEA
jgi:hypothetical protein